MQKAGELFLVLAVSCYTDHDLACAADVLHVAGCLVPQGLADMVPAGWLRPSDTPLAAGSAGENSPASHKQVHGYSNTMPDYKFSSREGYR